MAIEIEGVKLYTVYELAEALKVTPQTIRNYINQGKIKAQRVGSSKLITEKSIKEFLEGE